MALSVRRLYLKKRRVILLAAFLCFGLFFVWSVRVWGTAFGWFGTSSAPAAQVVDNTSTIKTTSTVERFIDGARVDPVMASGTLFAVMIDNAPDAGSTAGIENAPLVVEAPAEGGISRLLAFFLTGEAVAAIGPVRSARPYFIDFARMYDALYLHVGGAPAALDMLTGKTWDVDEYSKGQYFWRSGKRVAPHNVFTSTENIGHLADKLHALASYEPLWFFNDDIKPEDRGGGSALQINFGVTNAAWKYNKDKNVYERSVYGAPHTTVDNNQVVATNVIVATMPIQIIDSEGRLDIKTVGSGTALFLQNGKSIDGTWERLGTASPMRFFDTSGNEMRLARGTIWVEVVGNGVVWSNN